MLPFWLFGGLVFQGIVIIIHVISVIVSEIIVVIVTIVSRLKSFVFLCGCSTLERRKKDTDTCDVFMVSAMGKNSVFLLVQIKQLLPTTRGGNVFRSVCHSVHTGDGGCLPGGVPTGAVTTHPTGMHSCFQFVF